ncbi:core protein precursor pVII [Raptor adenovirus 1]|uniref:Core protein pVII n=1 Tax=Raptor adenovirus 1 TaxID=1520002 RepID=B6SBM7_9ADEN|nr:core protein precursor pVII [Raptor adenovirus 1]ACH89471.1 core protein precursor pVII [Raptor adenovirus 1]
MSSIVYSPADSRGWGIGNTAMRAYLIGGALEPSDVYTVRVREHWRRKSRRRAVAVQAGPVVVAATTPARRRRPRRAVAVVPSTRVLRSARRAVPMDITPVVPAPAPAATAVAVPAAAVQIGNKRRRIG